MARDEDDTGRLVVATYDELRSAAERLVRRQPWGFDLTGTDVLHEACLHFMAYPHVTWKSTDHFRAIAIRKMWQVIVDFLKKQKALRRGGAALGPATARVDKLTDRQVPVAQGWKRTPLESIAGTRHEYDFELLDLAEALRDLAHVSPRLYDVVTYHWLEGMTHGEVAQRLNVSASTAEKDFRLAVAWLRRRLKPEA